MGITYPVATFLGHASRQSPLGRTLTLGRQSLFMSHRQLGALSARLGRPLDGLAACREPYAETLLTTAFGATEVVAMDYSTYENAGIVHDLNGPVPPDLEQTFDTVIDGGTLEHVFDYPVALASCMRMLRPGGRLFLFTPGNSQMGHGFYQFSPELLYRALSPPHGFEVERMHAVQFRYVSTELATAGIETEIADPARLGTRTVVASRHPLSLHVQARKVRHLERPFASVPLQSDYEQAWKGETGQASTSRAAALVEAVWRRLPGRLRWPLWNEYGRHYRNTPRNRRWFARLRDR